MQDIRGKQPEPRSRYFYCGFVAAIKMQKEGEKFYLTFQWSRALAGFGQLTRAFLPPARWRDSVTVKAFNP